MAQRHWAWRAARERWHQIAVSPCASQRHRDALRRRRPYHSRVTPADSRGLLEPSGCVCVPRFSGGGAVRRLRAAHMLLLCAAILCAAPGVGHGAHAEMMATTARMEVAAAITRNFC
jgi:hypothetical protein